MPFTNIDAHGKKRDRQVVKMLIRRDGAETRKTAAQIKRDRKNAKRAHGPDMIVLYAAPPGGVSTFNVDGAYIARGEGFEHNRFQIVIVGPMRFTAEQYRDAAAAWSQEKLKIIEVGDLEPETPDIAPLLTERGFRSVIVEIIRS